MDNQLNNSSQEKKDQNQNVDKKQELESNFDNSIPEELLQEIPEPERSKIISVIRHSSASGFVSGFNPLSSKINENHITKLIENADNFDKRDREERQNLRLYYLLIFLISLLFLGFLIIFLKDDRELLYKIIIAIISFIGGFGFGKTQKFFSSD